MGHTIVLPNNSNETIITTALAIEQDAMNDIAAVLKDVNQSDTLGDCPTSGVGGTDGVLYEYGYRNTDGTALGPAQLPRITDASGAMVIDDLMQKISTKGQVAAQLLSTANNINKTVSRILSQG